MKKTIVLGSAFLLLGSVSGCGSDTHDKLIKSMIKVLDNATRAMKEIKDEKTADDKHITAVATALQKAGKRLKELNREAQAVRERLDPEEKARLEKEYKDKLQKAYQAADDEWKRIKKIPKVEQKLEEKNALAEFRSLR